MSERTTSDVVTKTMTKDEQIIHLLHANKKLADENKQLKRDNENLRIKAYGTSTIRIC
jgi:hypothetical protein